MSPSSQPWKLVAPKHDPFALSDPLGRGSSLLLPLHRILTDTEELMGEAPPALTGPQLHRLLWALPLGATSPSVYQPRGGGR